MNIYPRYADKRLGPIPEEVIEAYKKIRPTKKVTYLIEALISERLLNGKKITCRDDIYEAERYVKNMLFPNLGSWVDYQMRLELEKYYKICKNCEHCKESICDKRDKGPSMYETCIYFELKNE